jgi:hypothetical protein
MSKKFSHTTLREELAQLETLRDDQLNGLLRRLEGYKTKLPIEDHLIVDWGIGCIRARMQEEEQLMDEVWEDLKSKYDNYYLFIQHFKWDKFDLSEKAGKDELSTSIGDHLDNVIKEAYFKENKLMLIDFVSKIKEHCFRLCNEKGEPKFAKDLIDKYAVFYIERATESRQQSTKCQLDEERLNKEKEARLYVATSKELNK